MSVVAHLTAVPRVHSLRSPALAVAGLLFVAYPALRPYSSEVGLAGDRAFASWQWTVAHLCGVLGFALLAQTAGRLDLGPDRISRVATTATSLGAVLVLPYYGAEVFGVGAVGRWAVAGGSTAQADRLVEGIRFSSPAAALFAAGLLLLTLGGACLGRALWREDPVTRTAGAMVATGLVLYLPQFWFPPQLRVAHGVVLGLGLVLVAARVATGRPRC